MTSSDLSEILRIVGDSQNALIIGHAHPDGDCVGSAMALCEIAEALGCSVSNVKNKIYRTIKRIRSEEKV